MAPSAGVETVSRRRRWSVPSALCLAQEMARKFVVAVMLSICIIPSLVKVSKVFRNEDVSLSCIYALILYHCHSFYSNYKA